MQKLVTARAINWAKDVFARGAYSYTTLDTRSAQSALGRPDGRPVLFSGEALYRGRDMGTVEAALASGLKTAQIVWSHTISQPIAAYTTKRRRCEEFNRCRPAFLWAGVLA